MRSLELLAVGVAGVTVVASFAILNVGCPPASIASAPMSPSTTAASGAGSHPTTPSTSTPLVDGELETAAEVLFEVRPLSGPGTMGPTVLSAKSDPALEEVRAFLAAHPEAGLLRIECSINPMRMSSSPDARWPAGLALQVARWLVDHAIDCRRLEAVGRLDGELDRPQQRVRFFVDRRERARPTEKETQLDVCASLR